MQVLMVIIDNRSPWYTNALTKNEARISDMSVRTRPRRVKHRSVLLLAATLASLLFATCDAEFVYDNFERVTALVFNGDAKTTSCDAGERLAYQNQHGVNDPSTEFEPEVMREDTRFIEVETRRVNDHSTSGTVDVDLAGFSHRSGKAPPHHLAALMTYAVATLLKRFHSHLALINNSAEYVPGMSFGLSS